jgi:Ser/Thr protein kinase RdoA (MazF antagonist)
VASAQGLRVGEAVPVGTGSNVIVHLRPHPIVARVMTGTVVLHADPQEWLRREIDVGAFLGERGIPVVAPTKLVDPGPFLSGDLWVSLWDYVEVRETPLEATQIGSVLRSLHDGLAEYPGPLPPRAAVLDEFDWLLGALAGEDDAAALSAERDRVAEVILESAADPQPIHGDASFSNLLTTSAGPLWNDFEDVCIGPVAWDVAGVASDARSARGEAFSAEVLEAYGREFDPAALERLDRAHSLYGTLWRRYRQLVAKQAPPESRGEART